MNRIARKPLALSLGALLVAGSLILPAVTVAAGNNIKVDVPGGLPAVGGTFTANVVTNADVDVSGGQTTIAFDNTRLQLTAVAAGGSEFGSLIGLPDATGIANANAAGKVVQVGFNLVPPSKIAGGSGDHTWLQLTFQVVACGPSNLSIPANNGSITEDSYLLDTNGDPVVLTTIDGTVNVPCPTPTPAPTTTPVPTPTAPPASAAPGSGTTNVTGTVDAGFLGLTVPDSVAIPLVRNATNTKDVQVTVFSNIVWNLNVSDPKVANKGFMTDGSKVLANPMSVNKYDAANTLVNSVDLQSGGLLTSGANSANVTATLSQFVTPQDQPGSYGIQVNFAAVSGF